MENNVSIPNNLFGIAPVSVDPETTSGFTKLKVTDNHKFGLNALAQQIPAMIAADATSTQTYVLTFPKGVSGSLTALKQGGFGTMLRDPNGKFVGTASLVPASNAPAYQPMLLGAFSVMSIVTGQYFMTKINKELGSANQRLDKILEFLYGDKRAELLAELSFIQSAHKNYMTIMDHPQQRSAVLAGLIESKKIAIKDMEFYASDLENYASAKSGSFDDFSKNVENALRAQKCLELSEQLYTLSNVLMVFYSENYDTEYLSSVQEENKAYIVECERRSSSAFNQLIGMNKSFKSTPIKKIDASVNGENLQKAIDAIHNGSINFASISETLNSISEPSEYYLNASGSIYVKKQA